MPRTRSNKGVQLSRKPDKPHRIAHIPVVHGTRPSGCKVDDYELYIMSNGDLYEQDVRAADYHACLEQALMMFPLCTTNDVE